VRRAVCDGCLPEFDAERTQRLASAGKASLAAMRASPADLSRAPEARAKQSARSCEVMLANRAWEREHGRALDSEKYENDILPRMQTMSVSALSRLTGISEYTSGE
jgi:hypothetical protein